MPLNDSKPDRRCTCDVRSPSREHGYGRTLGGYAVYLSLVEDHTEFNPACPFHGERGSMVACVGVTS